MVGPEDVLAFWLGVPASLANSEKWYTKDPAFDAQIRDRFGTTIEAAARGELDGWRSTPRGRLAFVILLDQFSRNVFRGTPRSFAQDAMALATAEQALQAEDDASLSTVERNFLLMPLMHAEDMARQKRAIAEFERLLASAPPDLAAFAANGVKYAKLHAAVIERFGRFPHRNALLGRASTAEESEFLKQPGTSF